MGGASQDRTSHSFRRLLGAFGALSLAASALVVWGPLAVPAAHAGPSCTDTWTNTAGGDWGTATDWSEGTVPTISDVACITTAGTYTVTISAADGAQTVGGLALGGFDLMAKHANGVNPATNKLATAPGSSITGAAMEHAGQ